MFSFLNDQWSQIILVYASFYFLGTSDLGMNVTASLPVTSLIPVANLPISLDSAVPHVFISLTRSVSIDYFLPSSLNMWNNFIFICCADRWSVPLCLNLFCCSMV